MPLGLDDERRAELTARLQGYWLTEFDEELSPFRAEQLMEFLIAELGASIYNQAVQDARAWMLRKLEDLEGDVFAGE